MSHFIVALTGGIASGKTTVSDLFHQHYDVCVVDADLIAREVVAVGQLALAQIASHFGLAVLQDDGTLNRSYLKRHIFSDIRERAWLDALLHPLIRQEMDKQLARCQSAYTIAVIPLLAETGVPDFVDFVLAVDCPLEAQYQRLCARDDLDIELAQSIIVSQATREARLLLAHGVIHNELDTSSQQLKQQVTHWHHQFLEASYRLSNN